MIIDNIQCSQASTTWLTLNRCTLSALDNFEKKNAYWQAYEFCTINFQKAVYFVKWLGVYTYIWKQPYKSHHFLQIIFCENVKHWIVATSTMAPVFAHNKDITVYFTKLLN